MGKRNHYENGVFCWVDLATNDPEATKQFYGTLFGWGFIDKPVEGRPPYSMAIKDESTVAALFQMPEAPPHWQSYINVADLETTVQSWVNNGGTVISSPFDVMEAGRMAVVQDPTGGVVNLWYAEDHIGAGLVNEINTFCWTELNTRDSEKASKFYQSVFGWEIMVEDTPPNYITCKANGHYNCGIFDLSKADLPEQMPVHWSVYFNVENLDYSLEQVTKMGGKIYMDPVTIEPGRFAVISDSQGAVLTIMQLNQADD